MFRNIHSNTETTRHNNERKIGLISINIDEQTASLFKLYISCTCIRMDIVLLEQKFLHKIKFCEIFKAINRIAFEHYSKHLYSHYVQKNQHI